MRRILPLFVYTIFMLHRVFVCTLIKVCQLKIAQPKDAMRAEREKGRNHAHKPFNHAFSLVFTQGRQRSNNEMSLCA